MNYSRLDATKAYRLLCRLRRRQIPLDGDEFERTRQACLGLQIHEGGPGSAFNLPGGGAGYVFSVDIWNPSQRRLRPEHIVFEGFEGECRMRLLPDPQKVYPMGMNKAERRRCERGIGLDYLLARQLYVFPGLHWHRYSREDVLNHLIGPRGGLYPGDPPLEGFLLAVGQESIPWKYSDGDRIKVRLRLFYQGNSHAAWFHPTVERSREEKRLMKEIASPDPARIRARRTASAARLGIQIDPGPEQDKTSTQISRLFPVLT